MKTIRKGNDIVVRWRIFRYGQEYDIALYRESISLVLSNMGEKKEITDYTIVDVNTIVFKYRAEDQGLGIYRLLLIDKSRNSTRIIEECNAFRLVNTSDAANNNDTLESAITITLTSELTAPADGLSAYEVALQNGFIGTEAEWLQSLVPDTTDIELAEAQRQINELSRIESEEVRQNQESTRLLNEQERQEAEQLRETSESNRSLAEDTRNGSEQERNVNETSRMSAEEARNEKEQERQSAELNRQNSELERQSNELERIEAENTRQSAEVERRQALTEAISSTNAAATNAAEAATNANNAATNANNAATNANNAATTANEAATTAHQKAGEANAAASSANAVVEGFNSIIVQETGAAQDKVMSQKAVTDAMTASQAKLSELEEKVNGKQDALTLTVKDNGNIVIGNIQGQTKEFMPATPSGDPMHYAYVTAGAEYNDTGADIVKTAPWADMIDDDYTGDYGKTVVHKAGYWYLNGLGDLTNKSMQNAYTKSILCNVANQSMRFYEGQTNFNFYNFIVTNPLKTESSYASSYCKTILMNDNSYSNRRLDTGMSQFYNASKLLHIIGVFSDNTKELNNTFTRCNSLITLKFYGLKHNVSFSDSPNLSIKSVLYMINSEAATSAITITLHADAYARAMANADILAALEAHPNVSLASA